MNLQNGYMRPTLRFMCICSVSGINYSLTFHMKKNYLGYQGRYRDLYSITRAFFKILMFCAKNLRKYLLYKVWNL